MLHYLGSRTVIAGIIAFLFQVGAFFGVQLGGIDANSLTESVMNLVAAVSTLAAIFFRMFPRWAPKSDASEK